MMVYSNYISINCSWHITYDTNDVINMHNIFLKFMERSKNPRVFTKREKPFELTTNLIQTHKHFNQLSLIQFYTLRCLYLFVSVIKIFIYSKFRCEFQWLTQPTVVITLLFNSYRLRYFFVNFYKFIRMNFSDTYAR